MVVEAVGAAVVAFVVLELFVVVLGELSVPNPKGAHRAS